MKPASETSPGKLVRIEFSLILWAKVPKEPLDVRSLVLGREVTEINAQ